MKTKIAAIARELKNSVQLKELDFSDVKTDALPIILLLKAGFVQVKGLICDYEFESKEAEIHFFKETKPQIFHKLVYYNKIHNIEQHRPACGYEAIKENELLATYLDAELVKLKRNEYQLDHPIKSMSVDVWTDTKVALVELIYAIHTAKSVNRGNIDIKMLASRYEKMFHIDLGDFYRIFLEIRNRKGSRTTYLDRLSAALNKEMDERDSK